MLLGIDSSAKHMGLIIVSVVLQLPRKFKRINYIFPELKAMFYSVCSPSGSCDILGSTKLMLPTYFHSPFWHRLGTLIDKSRVWLFIIYLFYIPESADQAMRCIPTMMKLLPWPYITCWFGLVSRSLAAGRNRSPTSWMNEHRSAFRADGPLPIWVKWLWLWGQLK